MAWFDVGAGLAKAGEMVGQVAMVGVIEQQRAALERQRLELANELAGQRESAGRQEEAALRGAENEKQRGFLAGENEKNRASEERRTGMSTGATLAAARMQIDARREETEKKIAANREAAAKLQIGEDGVGYAVNPISRQVEPLKIDGQPLKFRDPDQAKARTELIRSYATQLNDLTRSYVPQINALEATVRTLEKDPLAKVDPQAKRELERAQAEVKALRERYEEERLPLINKLNQIGVSLGAKAKIGSPSPTGARPLSDFIRKPGGGGLIDQEP